MTDQAKTRESFSEFAKRALKDKEAFPLHPAVVRFYDAFQEHPKPGHPWRMFHGRKGSYWVCRRCGVSIGKPAVKLTPWEWLDWHLRRKHARR